MIPVLIIIISLLSLNSNIQAGTLQDSNIHCSDMYDEFRKIKYWGAAKIYLHDMHYENHDAEHLKLLAIDDNKRINYLTPKKSIVHHFNNEFNRTVKGTLPFHDTTEGSSDRFSASVQDAIKTKKDGKSSLQEFEAREEARRNALYGPHPGGVACDIRIQRHDFPVLYIIECYIDASKDLRLYSSSLLKEKDLGFSTPEHVEDELKRAITSQLELLGKKLEMMRNCSKQ